MPSAGTTSVLPELSAAPRELVWVVAMVLSWPPLWRGAIVETRGAALCESDGRRRRSHPKRRHLVEALMLVSGAVFTAGRVARRRRTRARAGPALRRAG